MSDRLTLDETWEKHLEMWKDISDEWDGSICVATLKIRWMEEHGYGGEEYTCFFCIWTGDEKSCKDCPGALVDQEFDCCDDKYHFRTDPKAFYQESLRLNAIRLEKVKDGKTPSDIQKN